MEALIVIGLWVLFGAWAANIAERKGYDRSMGWILGILLGIFGVIIVAVLRNKRLAPAAGAPSLPAPPKAR
jgi:uncharacterized membrane protein YeaQ/YmgE (transglycosylase-associated protein family)